MKGTILFAGSALRSIFCLFIAVVILASSPFRLLADSDLPEVRIGLLSALSGYAVRQGTDCKKAFDLARAKYAPGDRAFGYSLKFYYGDSQRKAKPAVSEFRRLVNIDGVQVVVLIGSPVGMALNPISKQNHVPLLGVVGHDLFTKENKFAYRIWPSASLEGRALANRIISDGHKQLAIFSGEDDWTLAMRESLLMTFKEKGVEPVYDVRMNGDETDFSSYISNMKSRPVDAVILNLVIGQPGLALRRLKELGVAAKVYGTYFAGLPDELATAGSAAEELSITELAFPEVALNKLAKKSHMPDKIANGVSYNCFVGAAMAIQALSKKANIQTPEDYHQALKQLEVVNSLNEVLPIKNREVQYDFRTRIVKHGRLVKAG